MQIHTVQYGLKDGFKLKIIEKPKWAAFVDHFWPGGPSTDPFATGWFYVTNWVFRRTHKTEKVILEVPISQEEAEALADGTFSWNWVKDDSPPAHEKDISVRWIGSPHLETRGTIISGCSPEIGDVALVKFLDGRLETHPLDELIDTRLVFEKERSGESR